MIARRVALNDKRPNRCDAVRPLVFKGSYGGHIESAMT